MADSLFLELEHADAFIFTKAKSADAPNNQNPNYFADPKQQELNLKEQSDQIQQVILREIQHQKEQKQQQKRQQEQLEYQQFAQQLSSFLMYLNIQRSVYINRELCQSKLNDDAINLYFKMKQYGSPQVNQTETYWNCYKLILNYSFTCPINNEIVNKMQNLPWIIELWGKKVSTNQDILLGISKVNLNLIHATIFTMNPLASLQVLRSNLYPLIVHDDEIPFEDLKTKQIIAVFRIKLAFGSSIQINRLQNQEIPTKDNIVEQDEEELEPEQPQSEVNEPELPPEPPVAEQMLIPLQDCMVTVLNQITSTIKILPREEYILIDEFIDITKQLCGNNFNQQYIRSLAQYLATDNTTLNWRLFLNSWGSFNQYKTQLKEKYSKLYLKLYQQSMRIYTSINQMERQIPQGHFGLVPQQELREYLLSVKGNNLPSGPSFSAIIINAILETLEINIDGQIQISQLLDYLRQIELQGEIRQLYIPLTQLNQLVENQLQGWTKLNEEPLNRYMSEHTFKQSLAPIDLVHLFDQLDHQITYLDAVVIMNQIGEYSQVEQINGVKVCAEIAFWKYVEWLQYNDKIHQSPKSPKSPHQHPSSPQQPKPIEIGTRKPIPLDVDFISSKIIIELVSIQPVNIDNQKVQLQICLENIQLDGMLPTFQVEQGKQLFPNVQVVFVLIDKYSVEPRLQLEDRLSNSGLKFQLFNVQNNNPISLFGVGQLAIEEILTINNEETFFISVYDNNSYQEILLLQTKISIQQSVSNRPQTDRVEIFNSQGLIPLVPQLSNAQLMEKLRPEVMHTFKLHVKSIRWFKKCNFDSIKFRISLATDKKQLKEAIPQFISDDLNGDFNFQLEYKVKCDQVLATQISKCQLFLEMILTQHTQNKSMIGYIPLKPLFEDKLIEGEIPMDDANTGGFICTLNIDTTYSTDEIIEQPTQSMEITQYSKQVYIRVLEFLLMDFENELGEIYFMIVSPFIQSESYEVRPCSPAILYTPDCIFQIPENDLTSDVVELQVRSVFLGEDKIIGSTLIQLTNQTQEGIYAETNYLKLDTIHCGLEVQARVGIKVIYVCTPNTSNLNYLQIFNYNAMKDLQYTQDMDAYLRNQLHFSFSEISFIKSLIKGDIFSTEILPPIVIEGERTIVNDLFKEFKFFDQKLLRYIDPLHLPKIFSYFNIPLDLKQAFIPSLHKRKPIDYESQNAKVNNHFDYLTFLAKLQVSLQNVDRLFQVNIQGPIQHEVASVLKSKLQSPVKVPNSINELHFEIISAHNLNLLLKSKRTPNCILSLPQVGLESDVFYCQNNPIFNALVSVPIHQQSHLLVQLYDKKYNAADAKQIYNNNLMAECKVEFNTLQFNQFPYVIDVPLSNTFEMSKQPYIKIRVWSDNQEVINGPGPSASGKKTKKTVRRLVQAFNDVENEPDNIPKDDENMKNLAKTIEKLLDHMKQPQPQGQPQPQQGQPQPQPQSQPQPKPQEPQKQAKPQFYSSSDSSSQPTSGPKQGKSSSSGTKLEKIQEKIPIQADALKRIEKILRQNNLPLDKYDNLQSDSDDYE